MCNASFHRTRVNMTKKKFNEMTKFGRLYYCKRKCINLLFPFVSITDKEFIKTSNFTPNTHAQIEPVNVLKAQIVYVALNALNGVT